MKVAVVGGGPAGSRTAVRLAQLGARVVVYEPRSGWEKPCGGGVPERALDHCPCLRDPRLPQRLTLRARIYSCRNREVIINLREPIRIFSRHHMNRHLLNGVAATQAEVRGDRVAAVSRASGRWRVHDARGRVEQFDFLVGADGANGIVRRQVDGEAWPRAQTLGLGYYLEGLTSDEIIVKFLPHLDGYLWVFPRVDHLCAGICGHPGPRRVEWMKSMLGRFVIEHYGEAVLRHSIPFAARIPSLPPGVPVARACQGENWALVGDAAGFVNPLTREGIHFALASANLLATALGKANPALYGERWARSFRPEHDWAAEHKDLFFSPLFLETLALLCGASPAIQNVVSDLIAGRQPYLSLRRRLLECVPSVVVSLLVRFLTPHARGTPSSGRSGDDSSYAHGLDRVRGNSDSTEDRGIEGDLHRGEPAGAGG